MLGTGGAGQQILSLAEIALRARRGDPHARARLLHEGLPLAADLYRPGAGALAARALGLLDELRTGTPPPTRLDPGGQDPNVIDGQWRELDSGTEPAADGPRLRDWSGFVTRLVAQRHGLYTVTGEPGRGKTTLALRLAQRIAQRHGYGVHAVGGLHPDDRQRWQTDAWVQLEPADTFIDAMALLQDVMTGEVEPRLLRGLRRRVLLLDDASLTASVGQVRANRALVAAWNVYRHVDWVIILTARTFKSVATVAEGADVRFLKRPQDLERLARVERDEPLEWWREAEAAYAALRRTADWAEAPDERGWVYADAPRLRFAGLVPHAGPDLAPNDAPRPDLASDEDATGADDEDAA